MKRGRVGRARTLTGLVLFVPAAVVAVVLPSEVGAGETDAMLASAATTHAPTGALPGSTPTTTPGPTSHPGPLRTRCRSVLYVGDSTSEGVISHNYLPDPADREDAQLRDVGVNRFIPEISGARSIVEHYKGQPSGADVVDRHVARGYRGCWVIALGNNDAADISVGATPGAAGRIDMVMRKIRDQPVLWVNTRTLVTSGPNAESNMVKWNAALVQACSRYPDLRVYDWASEVQPDWYTHTDNIHYTTPGYRQRSHRIARATAIAFPSSGTSPAGCTVSSR